MRQSLHSHVLFLESKIQTLRDRLTMGHVTAEEIEEIERQLAKAELALDHYREAYALEQSLSGPESADGAGYEPANRSGNAGPRQSDRKKATDGPATRKRKKAPVRMRPAVARLRRGVRGR